MYILIRLAVITILIVEPVIPVDICSNQRCQCYAFSTIVHCDTKGWKNLDDIDFPRNVLTLTLINNNLKFDTLIDRAKIENLSNLIDLSINQNPLGIIPPFINTKVRFLSLQDTSLTSAEVPSSYNNSFLQTISLNNNKIRSIKKTDFLILHDSKLNKLHIDSSSISMIDQNAFTPLIQLQSLSLKNNLLKSCEFLLNLPRLSSIKLDGNQFTSLPQQLSIPGKIQTYSFINNSISIIDESSPLYKWSKMNYTSLKISLAKNPFDCCLSLWFIRFLKISPQFIGDASLLTCATPPDFAGKFLIQLNPDEMNCGNVPSQSWWTTNRIIGVVVGSVVTIGIIVTIIIVFVFIRRRPSRSGYTEIDGIDDNPYSNIDPPLSGGPPFPEEDDDALSTRTYAGSTRSAAPSEAPTRTTGDGIYAADYSQTGGSQIHEAALIPHFH